LINNGNFTMAMGVLSKIKLPNEYAKQIAIFILDEMYIEGGIEFLIDIYVKFKCFDLDILKKMIRFAFSADKFYLINKLFDGIPISEWGNVFINNTLFFNGNTAIESSAKDQLVSVFFPKIMAPMFDSRKGLQKKNPWA